MHKASGRIITDMEYCKALMEKEEKKVDAERKALRREERERKKLEKEAELEQLASTSTLCILLL